MTDAEYRQLGGITASAIKAGRTSMRAMHAEMTRTAGDRDTPSMRWGRLVHLAILEPDQLAARVHVWDGGRRAGKAWDEFEAAVTPGCEIVTRAEIGELLGVSAAVHANREAHRLVALTRHEQVVRWNRESYGAGQARPDGYDLTRGVLLEVKTTSAPTAEAFARQFFALGYDLQVGWYCEGLEAIAPDGSFVLAVHPDNDVVVYRVSFAVVHRGREAAVEIARRYAACRTFGTFAGLAGGEDLMDLPVPAWAGGTAEEVEVGSGEAGKAGEL